MNNKVALIMGPPASGKAQPYTAKVLTENGYKQMGDLVVGDKVYGEDGKLHNIVNIYEQGLKDAYKVTFSDGSSTVTCDEHLWTYNYYSHGKIKQTTRELKDITQKEAWIQITEPVRFKEKEHLIDPYFLGVLLADGYIPKKSSIVFSTSEEYIVNKMKELLPFTELTITKQKGDNYSYVIADKTYNGSKNKRSKLKKELNRLGLLGSKSFNKFIPNEYLIDSIENRVKLLQGLIDCDGNVSKSKNNKGTTLRYTTTSKQLKDNICFILDTLGILFSVSEDNRKHKYTSGHCYNITIKLKKEDPLIFTNPKHLEKWVYPTFYVHKRRKFKKIEYIGKELMRCIEVDNPTHLYLTDRCIVTHNTASLRNINEPEGVVYFNFDGKGLPFKSKFKEVFIEDVADIFDYLNEIKEVDKVHTIIIDTITFMMDQYETQYVVNSSNTLKSWGNYQQFYKQVMHKLKASGKNVIVLAHEKKVMNEEEMVLETKVPVKGAVGNLGVEADFEVVLSAKKIPLKKLEYIGKTELLKPEPTDEIYGFKYVFQTMLDKDTLNEKMRSPMGMWKYPEEKYINNDVQLVIDRLNEYMS